MKDKNFWFRISKHNGTADTTITAEYRQFEVVRTEGASSYRKARTAPGYNNSLLPLVFIFGVS